MNFTDLIQEIETFKKQLESFGTIQFNSKDLRQLKQEIIDQFKKTEFNNKEERQQAWEIFQLSLDEFKNKQEIMNQENELFSEEAAKKVYGLYEIIQERLKRNKSTKEDFNEVKILINETFEFIKQNRFPSKERRMEIWDKFNEYRSGFRKAEDEYFTNIREQFNLRTKNSKPVTENILLLLNACEPVSGIEVLDDLLETFNSFLVEYGFENSGFEPLLNYPDTNTETGEEKKKSPLKTKSEVLRDIRKFLGTHRDELTKEDKQTLYDTVSKVQEKLDLAWVDYKEELQKRQYEWEERKKQNELKHQEWEIKQQAFLLKLQERLKSQSSFRKKLDKMIEDQRVFIQKLENRISDQQDYILKLHDQLNDLENKYTQATSDLFKEKVAGWIEEKKVKIESVKNDIRKIEDKIKEVVIKADELPVKIMEVENSIEEIRNNIAEVKLKLSGQ